MRIPQLKDSERVRVLDLDGLMFLASMEIVLITDEDAEESIF